MKNNKKDKCSNFDSKSWINPFGKTQYAHPKMEPKQSCQFSLAKPHKEEKNTQNNQSMYYLTERPRNDQASWADNNIIYSHTFSRCHKGRLFFMEWVNQSVVITWHLPSTTPPPLSKLFSDIIINFTKIKPDLRWREMGYLNTTIMNVNVMWMILFTNMEQQSSRR